MSDPQHPQPAWDVVDPGLGTTPAWAPPGTPYWTAQPSWTPPAGAPVLPPATPHRWKPTPVLLGVGYAVAGAVGAAVLVSSVFLSAAEEIGREMAQGLGEEIGESVGEGMTRSLDEWAFGGLPMEDDDAVGPVEQSPPVAPEPGPDPVLNAYAADCFAGELQACDDLYYESPPLSDYESYATTCGGRVKEYTVVSCTELD
ncbi:hypothetical protein ACI8AF_16090 [Blastococcus sp. SYSU D00669]